MGTNSTMPKVRAGPGEQGHLKPALPWKLSIRISFKNSELDLQFLLKMEYIILGSLNFLYLLHCQLDNMFMIILMDESKQYK